MSGRAPCCGGGVPRCLVGTAAAAAAAAGRICQAAVVRTAVLSRRGGNPRSTLPRFGQAHHAARRFCPALPGASASARPKVVVASLPQLENFQRRPTLSLNFEGEDVSKGSHHRFRLAGGRGPPQLGFWQPSLEPGSAGKKTNSAPWARFSSGCSLLENSFAALADSAADPKSSPGTEGGPGAGQVGEASGVGGHNLTGGLGPGPITDEADMAAATEEAVGITCYTNSECKGFRAVLKQRFSDFVVNEVDMDGNVVHLTQLTVSKEILEEEKSLERVEQQYSQVSLQSLDVEGMVAEFRAAMAAPPDEHDNGSNPDASGRGGGLRDEEDAEKLRELLERIKKGVREGETVEAVVMTPSPDKAYRTTMHTFFKKFPFLITDSIDGPAGPPDRSVRVRYHDASTASANGGEGRRAKDYFGDDDDDEEEDGGGQGGGSGGGGFQPAFDTRGKRGAEGVASAIRNKVLEFVMLKENKDTNEALALISRYLGVQTRSLGFAGTKDKRAITVQRVTVMYRSATKVVAINSRLFGIRLGSFRYVQKPLVLGDLAGNRFVITLRDVRADSTDAVAAAARSLATNGFINYFGLQRFGSGAVTTHSVGAALLRGEWQAVVDLILMPREGETGDAAEARRFWARTKDPDLTSIHMPNKMVAERALLSGLKKDPKNLVQAIGCIPRTMRMMYVHSYQSFLWNHAASQRVSEYGSASPVVGDIVLLNPNGDGDSVLGSITDLPVDEQQGREGEPDEINEAVLAAATSAPQAAGATGPAAVAEAAAGVAAPTGEAAAASAAAQAIRGSSVSVKVLTQEDIDSKKYTMEDVVLPLPGWSVVYPAHSTATVYHSLAKKDGISLTESPHRIKEYSVEHLPGGYRKLIQKPKKYSWSLLRYHHPAQSLCLTDLDAVNAEPPPSDVSHPSAGRAPPPPFLGFKQQPAAGYRGRGKGDKAGGRPASGTAVGIEGVEIIATEKYGSGGLILSSGERVVTSREEGSGQEECHGTGSSPGAAEESTGPEEEKVATSSGEDEAEKDKPAMKKEETEGGKHRRETDSSQGKRERPREVGDGGECGGPEPGDGELKKGGREEQGREEEGKEGDEEDRPRLALQIALTLPPSSYATMAIRELMKKSTSSAFHRTINDVGPPQRTAGAVDGSTRTLEEEGEESSEVA